MLKIRLKRVGRKHDPSFRVVLVDSHEGPKTGKINEILGFYDAKKDVKELKSDEIKDWISKGAQVSDTVHNLLVDQKIIDGKKINVLPKKNPIVKEEEVKEGAPKAEETAPVESTTPESSSTETPQEAPKEEALAEEKPADVSEEEVKTKEAPEEKSETKEEKTGTQS